MAQLPTGYEPQKNAMEMSDEELKSNLMSDYKQKEVKKSNFPTEITRFNFFYYIYKSTTDFFFYLFIYIV